MLAFLDIIPDSYYNSATSFQMRQMSSCRAKLRFILSCQSKLAHNYPISHTSPYYIDPLKYILWFNLARINLCMLSLQQQSKWPFIGTPQVLVRQPCVAWFSGVVGISSGIKLCLMADIGNDKLNLLVSCLLPYKVPVLRLNRSWSIWPGCNGVFSTSTTSSKIL